jgi:hypothetical protein
METPNKWWKAVKLPVYRANSSEAVHLSTGSSQFRVRASHSGASLPPSEVACNSPHSPPKLGGDALAQRGLGRSVQSRAATLQMLAKRSLLIGALRGHLQGTRYARTLNHPGASRLPLLT